MASQSSVADRLSADELFEQWSDRWEYFLEDFSGSTPSKRVSERLRDKVKSGNAERAIAGGHEGREVLELLQNARDAIRDDAGEGRVYIGVHDEGILVANTGHPFDLFDPEVEDAVTMIGESSKGPSDQEIGHKGVGLKSILATGDAFEIWTRHDAARDGLLRVRLSRAYITAALLSVLSYDTSTFDHRGAVSEESIQRLIDSTGDGKRNGQLNRKTREDIGKLPLFDFPVPLTTTSPTDPIANRASSLLAGDVNNWYGDSFRTAVFIEYEDDEWRDILDGFDLPSPESSDRSATDRADRLWSYLSRAERDEEEELTPETLVQLGKIETLLLERIDGTEGQTRERWEVDRTSGSLDGESIHHQAVQVTIDGTGMSVSERFDQFRFDDSDAETQLLVPRLSTPADQLQAYPLYLYYPIKNTSNVSLPYCLHGHFTVETNRKDLSLNSLANNRAVLERAIELIGRVAETAADNDFDDRYPWILLPPSPGSHTNDPSSQAGLLTWFRAQIHQELRKRACIPTVGDGDGNRGSVIPNDALLHWDTAICDGFLALYDVTDSLDVAVTDETLDRSFPTRATVKGYRSFPDVWEGRIEELLAVDDSENFATDVARSWAAMLGGHLDQRQVSEDETHLICEADLARSLFLGTVETILRAGTNDEQLTTTLDTLSSRLEGVYLLPCRHTSEGELVGDDSEADSIKETETFREDTLLLVPVEARSGLASTDRGVARARSVLWDIDSPERITDPPEVPRENSSFRVYFVDRYIEQNERARRILDLAGRPWGVRGYDGAPSYFRELLDTFATADSSHVTPLDVYFLAKQIDKLGTDSEDLQTDEGSFIPRQYVEAAIIQPDSNQARNLRRRLNLRNTRITLPQGGGTYDVAGTVLDDDWQQIRAHTHEGGEDTTDDWGKVDMSASPTWPAPTNEVWEPFLKLLGSDEAHGRLIKTLSLFGVSVFPGLEIIWMYGSGHPRPQHDPSWNPVEWAADDFVSEPSVPDRSLALQEALEKYEGAYQEWITAPGRHPQTTAKHSDKCDVKTDGILEEVLLAAWIRVDDLNALRQLGGETLLELLRRYEDQFDGSILRTGWTCSYDHLNKGHRRSQSVPTLLNWQLRHLTLWDSVIAIDSELAERWGSDGARFAYTVVEAEKRGPRASRLFPHVDIGELEFSEEFLRTLGVKSIDSFDATEASWHLQRLLEVLSTDTSLEEPIPLEIPADLSKDWKAAYNALMEPILRHLPAENTADTDLDLPFLSRLPIQRNGEWQVAPVEWLEENADEGRYYDDRSPKPWERRTVRNKDYWLLERPASGPFARLTDALGVGRVDVPKPVFDAEDLTFTDVSVAEFHSELRDRMVLLTASLEPKSDKAIEEFADDLDAAIADLRVADHFPEKLSEELVPEDLAAPQSGLYAPRDGEEAFVLNAAAYEDGPTVDELDGLANAVALLAEQPTKIATFREALDRRQSPSELAKRWRQRTFPIENVEQTLGTKRRRDFRQHLDALVSLANRFDSTAVPTADEVIEAVERGGENTMENFEQALRDGIVSEQNSDESSPPWTFLEDLRTALPPEARFIIESLFEASNTSWRATIADSALQGDDERLVIDWLSENTRAANAASAFPQSVRVAYARVLALREVWDRTDIDELNELDVWQSRLGTLSTKRDIAWTDQLPEDLDNEAVGRERLFYCTPDQRFQSLVSDPLLDRYVEALSDPPANMKSTLQQYVAEGSLPIEEASASAAEHQEDAFVDLQFAAKSGQQFSTGELLDATFEVQSASTRATGSRRGGGSTQYRGRGQQGEAAALVAIIDDTAIWLDDQLEGAIRTVRSLFRRLHEDQQNEKYDWHLNRVWEQELQPLLSSDIVTRESIIDWRENLEEGSHLRNHPLVRLCNATLEQGPGFDVIDPFGPLSAPRNDFDLDQFVPVEIKAVDGRSPPFNFRLTTNEYRRCKAFIRGGRSYVIRLVYVPDPDTPDWTTKTQFVSEVVLEDIEDAESLVRGDPFEEVVKGGYMNMSVGE